MKRIRVPRAKLNGTLHPRKAPKALSSPRISLEVVCLRRLSNAADIDTAIPSRSEGIADDCAVFAIGNGKADAGLRRGCPRLAVGDGEGAGEELLHQIGGEPRADGDGIVNGVALRDGDDGTDTIGANDGRHLHIPVEEGGGLLD